MHTIPLPAVRTALLYANTFAGLHLNTRDCSSLIPWVRNRLARRFAISN